MISKLISIQKELKVPKSQRNTFGNYNYRNCEDILEAVKPLLAKQECVLTISDSIENIGSRYYVKATARVTDGKDSIEVTAYAREAETKKGMDDSQITGSTSSYARKYALNGLFAIDDTKDADTDEYTKKTANTGTSKPAENKPEERPIKPDEPKKKVITVNGATKLLTNAGYVSLKTIDKDKLQKMYDSGFYAEANAEMEKALGVLSKSDQEVLNNF